MHKKTAKTLDMGRKICKTQEKTLRAWIQDAGKYPGARKSRPKAALVKV